MNTALPAASPTSGTGETRRIGCVRSAAMLTWRTARMSPDNTVPVGWVAQMLDELFAVAAQCEPQPVEVGDKIMSVRAQLAQFSPRECGVMYHNQKMGSDHTCGLPAG